MSRYKDFVKLSVRIPISLKLMIEKRAEANRRSFNQEVVWLLEQGLAGADDTEPPHEIGGTVILSLRVPARFREQLEQMADESRRSLNQQTLWVLESVLIQLRKAEQRSLN